MSPRVTITDVATRAGVSTGTVSAVLNDRSSVRAQTRQRVLEAIHALGYQPSSSARSLGRMDANGHSFAPGVGLLIKELRNPFYTEVVLGAQEVLTENGYLPFVCTSEGDYEKEGRLIEAFRDRFLSGVIVAPVLHAQADLSHLFMLRKAGYPFVLLEGVQGLPANVVSIDNMQAAQKAVSYLIEQGHEHIVHLAGPPYTQHSRDRTMGFEKAFSESPLRVRPNTIIPTGASFEEGYEACMAVFADASAPRPTALFCFNDLVAHGAIRALAERGLRIPDDVSVVGFDDIPSSAYLSVPLTTVRVPKREMGQQATDLLLRRLNGKADAPHERIILKAELVVRGSTRPLH